jgi:gliding motility-associated-like protein
VNGVAPCGNATATVSVSITPRANAGSNGSVSFCTNESTRDLFLSLGGTPQAGGTWSPALASGTGVFNPSIDAAGVYTYTVNGVAPCGVATATVTVSINKSPNAGVALNGVIVCTGQTDLILESLLDGTQDSGGVWTDNITNQVVSSPISIANFATGIYLFTYTVTNSCGVDSETVQFTVNESPVVTSNNVKVTTPICLTDSVTVTIDNLENVLHSITYELSGSNSAMNQTITVLPINGVATFTLSQLQLANAGVTTITIKQITTTVANCSTVLSDVSSTIVVNPIPNVVKENFIALPICIGNPGIVSISNASGLIDGNYIFNYTITNNGTSVAIVSNSVAIKSGSGQLIIPASNLVLPGIYLIDIQGVTNSNTGCSSGVITIPLSIEVQLFPNPNNIIVEAFDVCIGSSNEIFIKNAVNLTDGKYLFSFKLGASVAENIEVQILNGTGSFILASSRFTTAGNVTLELLSVSTPIALCATAISNTTTTFNVKDSATPTIVENGNVFCQNSNSTLADLTLAIVEKAPVFWYATPELGTPLDPSTILVSGVTYYASFISANGCESTVRLAVTIEFEDCIVIPDGFSPNGDGINETFTIKNLVDYYPNFTIEIFNRYGSSIYSGNKDVPDWDGKSSKGVRLSDGELPVGVYFYVINFNDGVKGPKQGRLYLSR